MKTKPGWADVVPILRAECWHCHGGTAVTNGGGVRYDFFDAETDCGPDLAQYLKTELHPFAPRALAIVIEPYVLPMEGKRPLMPPAPAPPLQDWEIRTIQNWTENNGGKKGDVPPSNRGPTITVSARTSGNQVVVSYLAADADGDSIVGELRVGAALHAITAPGSGRVAFDISAEPPGPLEVSARLCDGWVTVTPGNLASLTKN